MKPKVSQTELLALTVHKILKMVPAFKTEDELRTWLEDFKKKPDYEKEAIGLQAYKEAQEEIKNLTFLY